ncbi:hypothetical protein BH10CYA1_BH10CYA1_38800 [soil metagenome]
MLGVYTGTILNSVRARQPDHDGVEEAAQGSLRPTSTAKTGMTSVWAIGLYLCCWIVVLWAALALPGLDDPMCFGILADKHKILDETASPKIICIGGSNLLFGIDGVQLEKRLHRPVVNMGLCLMFPLQYLFDEIKDNVHSGDVVVLSPEYADYSQEYANNIAVADILDTYPRALYWILRSNCLNQAQLQVLFGHVRALGLQKLDYASRHIGQIIEHRCRWTHGKFNPGLDVLNKDNLDKCGDLTWHLKQKADNQPSPVLFLVSSHLGDAEAKSINDFGVYCADKGARFVMIPPSVSATQYNELKPKIDSIVAECKTRLSVPLVATPERYAFPVKMIFNSQYHLNKIGRSLRAKKMIEDLQPVVDSLNKSKS